MSFTGSAGGGAMPPSRLLALLQGLQSGAPDPAADPPPPSNRLGLFGGGYRAYMPGLATAARRWPCRSLTGADRRFGGQCNSPATAPARVATLGRRRPRRTFTCRSWNRSRRFRRQEGGRRSYRRRSAVWCRPANWRAAFQDLRRRYLCRHEIRHSRRLLEAVRMSGRRGVPNVRCKSAATERSALNSLRNQRKLCATRISHRDLTIVKELVESANLHCSGRGARTGAFGGLGIDLWLKLRRPTAPSFYGCLRKTKSF
jgi:hypothetical protein